MKRLTPTTVSAQRRPFTHPSPLGLFLLRPDRSCRSLDSILLCRQNGWVRVFGALASGFSAMDDVRGSYFTYPSIALRQIAMVIFLALAGSGAGRCDIFRWDTGEVIPGTEGIEPGPGVDLSGLDLSFARLRELDLTGANLSRATLHFAQVSDVILDRASFRDAVVTRALFNSKSLVGADFQGANLAGASLSNANLTDANFAGADLTETWLHEAQLGGARFDDAYLVHGSLVGTTSRGFTREQLESSRSYRWSYLPGLKLSNNEMRGWNLDGFFMAHAWFDGARILDANLSNAVLFDTFFRGAELVGVDLHGANLERSDFRRATITDSDMSGGNLEGSSFREATLTNVDLTDASLANVNLRAAKLIGVDARGATGSDVDASVMRNTIFPDGRIEGVELLDGLRLVVHNHGGEEIAPVSIFVKDSLRVYAGGQLEFVVDSEPWHSVISFEENAPVGLYGELRLSLAQDLEATDSVGQTSQLFDWTGVAPDGELDVRVAPGTSWDLKSLYSSGEVTLTAVHILGDVNGDGLVSTDDFNTLKSNFGGEGVLTDGDLTGDFVIDLNDFSLLKANFGASPVPEPGCTALLALAFVCCSGMSARRRAS